MHASGHFKVHMKRLPIQESRDQTRLRSRSFSEFNPEMPCFMSWELNEYKSVSYAK